MHKGDREGRLFCFSQMFVLYIIQTLKEICMQKSTGKKQVSSKPKKLSKCAKWWQKHPEGIGLKILDMRAVLR